MKKLLLTIAAGLSLAFSASAFAAPQADSCLKLACPNNYDSHTNPNGWINKDSVRIDSCVGSPTYLKPFVFRYVHLGLSPGQYPFDSIIKPQEIKFSSDIIASQTNFKNAILSLENKYGKFYFIREAQRNVNQPDSAYIYSPSVGIYLERYAEVEELKNNLQQLPGAALVVVSLGWGIPHSAIEDQTINLQSPSFTPNPVKSKLTLLFDRTVDGQKIKILNLMGILIKEIDFSKEIDVSELSAGIYFLQTNDKEFKFIKE